MVYRIYVEKKKGFDHEAQNLLGEVHGLLGIQSVTGLRLLNRYDVEGVSEELFRSCIPTVFSEPPVDDTCDHCPEADVVFAVEYLPGQFDQRAASASECIQLISQGERPTVRTARVYLLTGNPTEAELAQIKKYVINPVEAREASLSRKDTLQMDYPTPSAVETLTGFCELDEEGLANFVKEKGLAMDEADIAFCQNYFRFEKRDPTITEIRMIDTYWSDHCRHTTFGTILDEIEIRDVQVKKAFDNYLTMRKAVYAGRKKNMCLMDLATIGAKYLASIGKLKNLDESEEINACTVKIKCDVDGEEQDWLYLFKNETHNHPTEIEPFGGAATCIGGAIRDPLSGRSYVYQAMRVTGAGDPLVPVSETMAGKLPQRKLVTTAAAGYSSYGNQIGLATGQVDELYHPGYAAKRLEIGAVVALPPLPTCAVRCPPPATLWCCWAVPPAATAAAAPPAPPRPTSWKVWKPAALRCRRATPPSSASCSASSAAPKPPVSSSAATTLAQAACPLPSASWRTVWRSAWTPCGKSTRAWTAPSWPSVKARSAWPLCWLPRTWKPS